jgi:hypothetical protein
VKLVVPAATTPTCTPPRNTVYHAKPEPPVSVDAIQLICADHGVTFDEVRLDGVVGAVVSVLADELMATTKNAEPTLIVPLVPFNSHRIPVTTGHIGGKARGSDTFFRCGREFDRSARYIRSSCPRVIGAVITKIEADGPRRDVTPRRLHEHIRIGVRPQQLTHIGAGLCARYLQLP